jgi:hypothetical protein
MGWKCLSASVIGTGHIAHQKPCQDAHGLRTLDNGVLIVAVADGAGSAKRSEEGSRCVVETSLDYLAEHLKDEPLPSKEVCEALLVNAIEECRTALLRLVPDGKFGDVATTLLLTVVTDQWLSTAQIGDGAVVCRTDPGGLSVLSDLRRGEYVNETTVLTSSDYRARLHQVTLPSAEVNGLAMFSDGIEFLAVRYSDNTAHEPFFTSMFDFAGNDSSTESELVEFLQSERVCERTDDDKTLVLAIRHDTDR